MRDRRHAGQIITAPPSSQLVRARRSMRSRPELRDRMAHASKLATAYVARGRRPASKRMA
jgi:hypothetical protein